MNIVGGENRPLTDARRDDGGAIVAWPSRPLTPGPDYVALEPLAENEFPVDRLEKTIATAPDRPALVTDDGVITAGAFNGRANAIAHRLLSLGCKPGALIALFLDHGTDKAAAAVGVLKAGAAYTAIDPGHKDQGIKDLLGHSEATIMLTANPHGERARRLSGTGVRVVDVAPILAEPVADNPVRSVDSDTMSIVIYTSGSTGNPKGVRRTFGYDRATVIAHLGNSLIGRSDRVSFTEGFWMNLVQATLISGAVLYPFNLRKAGLGAMRDWLLRHRITYHTGILTGFRQFLASLGEEDLFPDMRLVAVTGEPLRRHDAELFDRYFPADCVFLNNYSSSEFSQIASFAPDRKAMPAAGDIVPIGYPVTGTEVRLLNENDLPAAPGEVGEIVVHSPVVGGGYWRDPALSERTFLPISDRPGWREYRTGDLAVEDATGCLHGRGRADLQIKIRGHRVMVDEIENLLVAHPSIAAAVVALERGTVAGTRLVGYVIYADDAARRPTTSELRGYLGRQLPDPMVPSVFMPVTRFEQTATGKVDRRALPAPKMDIGARPVVAPADAVETALLQIWQELLDADAISVEDDFFLIGGDSLMALSMVLKAEERLDRRIPFESLWLNGSTIRALAQSLSGAAPAVDWHQALPLQTGGTNLPLFVVSMVSMPVYCLALIPHLGGDQPVYGLPAKGIGGDELPDRRVEDMADHCIRMMRRVQPDGPYQVMGHSAAGLIAFEIARQLRDQGNAVSKLVLLDSDLPRGTGALAGKVVRQPLRAARYAGSLVGQSLGLGATDDPITLRSARAGAYYLYRPKPYDGSATLITSAERANSDDLINKWQSLVTGGLTAVAAPGDHISMLKEPHVGELARILARTLKNFS